LTPTLPTAGLSTPQLAPERPAQISVAPVSVAPNQAPPSAAALPARLERRFVLLDGQFPLPAAGYAASVRLQIRAELLSTARAMPEADGNLLETVAEQSDRALAAIQRRLDADEIDPLLELRVDPTAQPVAPNTRPIKVGVYPVAGDPLHWGHLIVALRAIGDLSIDKVVFVLAGDDPRKQTMTPVADRHPMGQEVLGLFAPFFTYSPIAIGTQFDGETNIFRLLALNSGAPVEAWYMVGDDHYRLKDKSGNPDTLPKLEANREKFLGGDGALHRLKVAFIERERPTEAVPTSLEVKFVKHAGFEASSSEVRAGNFALVPDVVRRYALDKGLYGLGR
jgi:nicotinic acid mononucleotide adenylyltransferase